MFRGDQLQNLLAFPFRDEEARKRFLIASLVGMAGFVIPILPWLALYGYAARMMRQVIDENREPSMPEWTDWNELLIDGLRFFVLRLVLVIPIFLLLFLGFAFGLIPVALTLMAGPDSTQSEVVAPFMILGLMVWMVVFLLAFLVLIPLTVILGAAEGHLASKRSLASAFRVGEWWPIFRRNAGNFALSYLIVIAFSVVANIAIQVLFYTIIFICLLPFILAPYVVYVQMLLYALYARAYAEGREKLAVATTV